MLAALLVNEPRGGYYEAAMKTGVIDGKFFIARDGSIFSLDDIEDEKERRDVVKKVVKAVRKSKLPKVKKKEVERAIPKFKARKKAAPQPDYETLAKDLKKYREFVEFVQRLFAEEEEMALMMLLLEID